MHNDLNGKRVLIVGGSSGIGLAVARHAQECGAHIIIASRHAEVQDGALRDLLGDTVETHSFDITSGEDHARLFGVIGNIDHLVITVRPDITSSPFQNIDINMAKRAFETKFWGQYRLIQVAYVHINASGSITLTSGIAGEKIYKGASTMALLNSATETFCRVLAVELAPLRVNVVSPGFVESKSQEIQDYASQFPAKRPALLDEVAATYISLISNTYATGSKSVVDGGARLI